MNGTTNLLPNGVSNQQISQQQQQQSQLAQLPINYFPIIPVMTPNNNIQQNGNLINNQSNQNILNQNVISNSNINAYFFDLFQFKNVFIKYLDGAMYGIGEQHKSNISDRYIKCQ